MADKYYVYRPMLDLIGKSEGTDRKRGYNETLGYGAYTGGDVNLVGMTLTKIDALQTKMLKHPANYMNSSALGRYQIVRTTLRNIRNTLNLEGSLLFNEELQDKCACYLLGVRGIDKWIAGRLSDDTMLNNLAREWASLPMPNGKGAYGGQHAAVTVAEVMAALRACRARASAPKPAPVIVPATVPPRAGKRTLAGWIAAAITAIGAMVAAKYGGKFW